MKNVAAVFITASLPPFARPGARLDVTVSSVGDAKSLVGGVLLMSALHGPDGQIYAEAQGPLVMGGYSAGNGTNGKEVNSTTVGIDSEWRHRRARYIGRSAAISRPCRCCFAILISPPQSKSPMQSMRSSTKRLPPRSTARASMSTSPDAGSSSVPLLISRVQNLSLSIFTPAKIVINERTGTIVLGGDVKLTPVSVIHGNLSIEVTTSYTRGADSRRRAGFNEHSRETGPGGQQSENPGGLGQSANPGDQKPDQ